MTSTCSFPKLADCTVCLEEVGEGLDGGPGVLELLEERLEPLGEGGARRPVTEPLVQEYHCSVVPGVTDYTTYRLQGGCAGAYMFYF